VCEAYLEMSLLPSSKRNYAGERYSWGTEQSRSQQRKRGAKKRSGSVLPQA